MQIVNMATSQENDNDNSFFEGPINVAQTPEADGAAIPQAVAGTVPVKRGRGRPKGSKNRPKSDGGSSPNPKKTRKSADGRNKNRYMTMQSVNSILKSHGVTDISKVSMCLRAGILHGHVKLMKSFDDPAGIFGLDQVIAEGECFMGCGETLKCRVRDILYQPDFGGCDYESGGENATFHCKTKDCPGIYVSDICRGKPGFDSGKFHNHCRSCPSFGICIGDYREVHCRKCANHFYGLQGRGKCYTCFPN